MDKADMFAQQLKALRVAAGWTQQELADKAGLNQAAISHLESSRNKPSWDAVIALADALGVDCKAFVEAPKPLKKKKK